MMRVEILMEKNVVADAMAFPNSVAKCLMMTMMLMLLMLEDPILWWTPVLRGLMMMKVEYPMECCNTVVKGLMLLLMTMMIMVMIMIVEDPMVLWDPVVRGLMGEIVVVVMVVVEDSMIEGMKKKIGVSSLRMMLRLMKLRAMKVILTIQVEY